MTELCVLRVIEIENKHLGLEINKKQNENPHCRQIRVSREVKFLKKKKKTEQSTISFPQ